MAAELGLALLGEGPRAFLRVLAAEHGHADPGLGRERVVLGHALGLPDRPQDRPHRDRPVRGDLLRDLQRPGQRLAVRHDAADQADLQRLRRGNVPAGQQELGRQRVRELPRQTYRGAAEREQPPARLGDAEPRALAGHPDVGGLEDLGAARDGRPLDGGDQRLGQPAPLEQRLDHRGVPVPGAIRGVLVVHGLQVGPGAERAARAGQHADPDPGIGVHLVPGLAHQGHHRAAEGVARPGPVHRDDQDVPPALDERVRLRGRGRGSQGHAGLLRGLPKTVTRSSFVPVALNFADLFEHAADVFGERTAVASAERQVTYRELDERTNQLAHHLAGLGVEAGDHVRLYPHTSIDAAETLIASCKLRAVSFNINYRYTENELLYMFADADLAALVCDRQFAPNAAAASRAVPGLRGVVVIEDGSDADLSGGTGYATALAAASPARDFPPRSNDDVYMIYTGGTTGYPKGVMWRHEDIWRTLAGGIDFLTGIPLADEWEQSRKGLESSGLVRLTAAPLIHGAAQVATLGALFGGDTVVLPPRFDPHEVWRAVERHRANLLFIVGDAMGRPLIEAYREGSYDASSMLAISSSGALFSAPVKDAFAAALPGVFLTDAIGSTETGFTGIGQVTAGARQRGGPTVTPGPEVIVLDDQGRRAAPGQVGRIARGGHVPLGYYKDPVKTAAMLAEVDGRRYAVPGDLARLEADGSVTLLGRGSTCVNTGGEKVFPEEVESALKSCPGVFDALVIGVPDGLLGQRVAALVQLREGQAADLPAIEAHVRGQIAGYKVPRSIWLVEAISRGAAGKPDYHWARRHAASHPPDRPIALASDADG